MIFRVAIKSLVLAVCFGAWINLAAQNVQVEPAQGEQLEKPEKKTTTYIPPQVKHEANDFYLRLSIGYGLPTGNVNYTDGNVTSVKDGIGAAFNLHLGYTIIPNFIVFTEIGTTATKNSILFHNDIESTAILERFNMTAFGLGVTYYLMPFNIYISPVIRIPQLIYEIKKVRVGYTSGYGIGFGLSAGFELMVSDSMATGLGLNMSYDLPSSSDLLTIKSADQFYVGLSATLTYN